MTEYDEAHLFVAGIRILTFQRHLPPTVEDVCEALCMSPEWGAILCNKLERQGIIKTTQTPYSIKLFVDNHLQIEKFSRQELRTGFHKEIEDFSKTKNEISSKVEAIQAELNRKKQNLFADLEKKMKNKQQE
jgi:hypothetical protein